MWCSSYEPPYHSRKPLATVIHRRFPPHVFSLSLSLSVSLSLSLPPPSTTLKLARVHTHRPFIHPLPCFFYYHRTPLPESPAIYPPHGLIMDNKLRLQRILCRCPDIDIPAEITRARPLRSVFWRPMKITIRRRIFYDFQFLSIAARHRSPLTLSLCLFFRFSLPLCLSYFRPFFTAEFSDISRSNDAQLMPRIEQAEGKKQWGNEKKKEEQRKKVEKKSASQLPKYRSTPPLTPILFSLTSIAANELFIMSNFSTFIPIAAA